MGGNCLNLKSFDLSLEIGFGSDIFFQLFKLSPEIRYSRGLINLLKNNDGKMPDDWLELVPRDVVEQYSAVFIPELKGVNYLHFLRALEKLFEVESQSFFGRGSQAGGIIKVIQEKLQY